MVILRGATDVKEVALLFDDGPNPLITPKLLILLQEKGVKANFFLIGMRAEEAPEIARQIAEAGHEIGNHTYTHKRLTQILQEHGEQAVCDEIIKGARSIQKAANIPEAQVKFLRPPYLDWNEDVNKIGKALYGDNIVMSGLAVSDWEWGEDSNWDADDKKAIRDHAQHIIEGWKQVTSNGTLLGFHDSSQHNLPGNSRSETWTNRALPTLAAIPDIIDQLLTSGYTIKRLSDMELVKASPPLK